MRRGTYYVNQNDYPQIPYMTDVVVRSDPRFYEQGNVKLAGCGLCSAAMLVYDLLGLKDPLEKFIDLSYQVKANHEIGTDMLMYGPALAVRYDLDMNISNEEDEVTACLAAGGACIANVGGDREGHTGVFSHGGHYIYIYGYDPHTKEFQILDPSWEEGKYEEEGRQGKVRKEGDTALCTAQILKEDTANRTPGYYLFSRRDHK